MKVILLQDVKKLGKKGDTVKVIACKSCRWLWSKFFNKK